MALFDSELMLLTGAGASIPVNIPGMVGMIEKFKEVHGKTDPVRKDYESLTRAGVPEDLEEVLQFCNRLSELREGQVTDVLLDAVGPRGGGIGEFQRRLSTRIESAENLRDALTQLIGNVCLRFDRESAMSIYGDLVPLLATQKVPVFTTNYDGVLDEVAVVKNVGVADNFVTNDRGRSFWDSTHNSFSVPGLRIIKLHGSIYWHVTADSAVIEKITQPAPRNAEGKPVSQLLIFPTRFKDIYQQNYFPMYSEFTRTLGRATTLVLIGHSLRDEYLLAAVRERLRDDSFRLVVVDVELPETIRNLQGRERVLFLDGGIEKAAPILCRALADHRVSKKLFEYLQEARSAIKRGRKEKIAVTGVPKSAIPGQLVKDVMLSVETLLGLYSWGAFIFLNEKWERLSTKPAGRTMQGLGKKTIRLSFTLPKKLESGQTYQLSFTLFDEKNKEITSVNRKLRMKRDR